MTKREVQSLTGLLQHATKVVRPGRAFMRRLHVLQSVGSSPSHNVRMNVSARADIVWWHTFVSQWNGVSMLWDHQRASPDVRVVSDASGSWGCGAVALPEWFSLEWPPRTPAPVNSSKGADPRGDCGSDQWESLERKSGPLRSRQSWKSSRHHIVKSHISCTLLGY